jgi:neutral amino acid transport system substrate-binding protein
MIFYITGQWIKDMERRRFLIRAGSVGVVAATAGCSGGTSGGGSTEEEDGGGNGGDGGDGTATATETAADTSTSGGDTVKVGVLLPFSGDYNWVGANVMPVAEMIRDEINEAGGIGGRQVELVQGDTEGSPDASLSATQRLIEVEGVTSIIGPTSITMSAVFDQFGDNKVPVVTPTAGTTSLDERGGEYVFRTVASDSLGGRAIAQAARDEQYNGAQSYDTITMIVGNEEVFQSFKQPVRSSFEEFGGSVADVIDFRTGKASYNSEVQSMLSSDPSLTILIGSKEDSIKIMEAAFQAGYEGNWFATQDQTTGAFLEESDNRVTNGMLGIQAAAYQEATAAGRLEDFSERVTEYTGEGPRQFGQNTFDAMNVVGLAMKQLAADGEDITGANVGANIRPVANAPEQEVTGYTEGASAIDDGAEVNYQGLVGPIEFDDMGDIVAPFSILTAQDGEWVQAARLPPEALQ